MKEIPPLPPSTILLVEVGSTAHGTGLPGGEDHDEMGVVVEGPAEVVGLDESRSPARLYGLGSRRTAGQDESICTALAR